MIISHKHKFIFIKTKKTAGTSIEIALSKFCGPKDVITPISPEDEELRQNLGFPGPQNYKIPFLNYKFEDIHTLRKGESPEYFSHCSASFIRRHVSKRIWESYFKFCFERNPWDKTLSWYHWKNRNNSQKSVTERVQSPELGDLACFDLYTDRSKILMDRVFKFEELDAAMKEIQVRLELPEVPGLPAAKTGYRKDRRHYRDVLSEDDKTRIARMFSREIICFNYQW